jgi:Tol biopolymer transport system component
MDAHWFRPVAVLGAAVALVAVSSPAALAHPPGVTEVVSVGSAGAAGDNDSSLASISGDGRYVAFWSLASNLVPGDTNGTSDVFVRDRVGGTIERVSVTSRERQAVGGDQGGVLDTNFGRPVITPDGRSVVFESSASNLVPGEPEDFAADVYLRDVPAGTTEGISTVTTGFVRHSRVPTISADGRFVACQSWDGGLVPGDTNDRFDIFVFDRTTGVYERVSVDSAGVEGNNDSLGPAMTPDGRFVAFTSDADNLVAGDGNFDVDVFVHDRVTHTTIRASVRTDGTETGFELGSGNASLSTDGQVVAFDSEGTLVPQDTGFPVDVFVHDEQP